MFSLLILTFLLTNSADLLFPKFNLSYGNNQKINQIEGGDANSPPEPATSIMSNNNVGDSRFLNWDTEQSAMIQPVALSSSLSIQEQIFANNVR